MSLVDDTGIDEVVLATTRLMMKDLNLSVSSIAIASEASMQWSKEKNAGSSSLQAGSVTKTHRVILMVLNSSIFKKFEQSLEGTMFEAEQTGSVDSTEEVLADTNSEGLPIFAIAAAPTISDGQQTAMKTLAAKYSIPCIITVPRSLHEELEGCKK